MSLFQWEHQLFCYDWLFYKCFSVPFCRNVLTRSGYWLLITQLNCLYCTTDFLGITLTTRRRERRKKTNVNISSSHWLHQLQSLNTLLVITVNITSYESLIVYYCKYILKFVQRAHRNKKKTLRSTFCRASSSQTDCTWALLLLSVSEAPVKSEINKCEVWTPVKAEALCRELRYKTAQVSWPRCEPRARPGVCAFGKLPSPVNTLRHVPASLGRRSLDVSLLFFSFFLFHE